MQFGHFCVNQEVFHPVKYGTLSDSRKNQAWRQGFPDCGMTLPARRLKYDFQDTINANSLRKIAFHFPTGASMFQSGTIAL